LADQIDRSSDLSRDGKHQQRSKITAQATADFDASKALTRAREAVRQVVEQWNRDDVSPEIAKARVALLKAMKEAESGWQRAIDLISECAGRTTGPNRLLRGPAST
jgi:hypothetical protein